MQALQHSFWRQEISRLRDAEERGPQSPRDGQTWDILLQGILPLRKRGAPHLSLHLHRVPAAGHHQVYHGSQGKECAGKRNLPRQSGSRSMPKATVPESMTDCLLTNATTHFKSRCMRLCGLLGVDRNRTANCVDNAFRGMWDLVDEVAREHDHSFGPSKRIRPLRPEEEALRVRCSHLQAVYRVTDGMNRQKEEKQKEEAVSEFCLAPLRTSCIPKHVKIHTEILAQILVPHKEAVLARKNALTRNHYNDWVWNRCWPGRRWIAS